MKLSKLVAALGAISISSASLAGTLLSEGFDNIATLAGSGWVQKNNSSPVGPSNWFQGNAGVFTAASGADDSYIGANFLNASVAGGAISNWLITPTLDLSAQSTLDFLARVAGGGFLDTIEVRLSTNGASTDVGATAGSVGDFTTLLGSYSSNADEGWKALSFAIGGLGGGAQGRVAFRYVVADSTVDGNYIGIDSVNVVPAPATLALVGLGLAGLALTRRKAA